MHPRMHNLARSKTNISDDGLTQQTRDIDNRVTSVTYPDGKTNKIEYDDNGDIKSMQTAEGNTVTREGDHWIVKQPNGQTQEWKGKVNVSADGTITVTNENGTGTVRHPDGRKETTG